MKNKDKAKERSNNPFKDAEFIIKNQLRIYPEITGAKLMGILMILDPDKYKSNQIRTLHNRMLEYKEEMKRDAQKMPGKCKELYFKCVDNFKRTFYKRVVDNGYGVVDEKTTLDKRNGINYEDEDIFVSEAYYTKVSKITESQYRQGIKDVIDYS